MRPVVACTLLVATLSSTACHAMKPVSLEQLNLIEPEHAWVTSLDQSVVVIRGPRIVGDSLVGYVDGKYNHYANADVKQVSVEALAPTRTALLTIGIAAGLGVSIFEIAESGKRPNQVDARPCDVHPVTPNDCF
jgi:hypothetical protein